MFLKIYNLAREIISRKWYYQVVTSEKPIGLHNCCCCCWATAAAAATGTYLGIMIYEAQFLFSF